ncbi:MAG: hypothetical protein FWC64_08315 [Treponema sp.]|nr:hypothetical protein [Treponema sp.]
MVKVNISRLNLVSPLYYTLEKDFEPFGYKEGDGEKLFCFELDETQAMEFDPGKTDFLKNLVFSGRAEDGADRRLCMELPQGNYLFAQQREILGWEEIAGMAVEVQQEGLWQRLSLGGKLYLRYLFEDGCCVTQLFRPYEE